MPEVENLAISEARIEVSRPACIVNFVLAREHPLDSRNTLPRANPWHVAIGVTQLRPQVPGRGLALTLRVGFQNAHNAVAMLSYDPQQVVGGGGTDALMSRRVVKHRIDDEGAPGVRVGDDPLPGLR